MIKEIIDVIKEYKLVRQYSLSLIPNFFSITHKLLNTFCVLFTICLVYLFFSQPLSSKIVITQLYNLILLSIVILFFLKATFFKKWKFSISLLIAYFFLSIILLYSEQLDNLVYFFTILITFYIYLDFGIFSVNNLSDEMLKIQNQTKINLYYLEKYEALSSYYKQIETFNTEEIDQLQSKIKTLSNEIGQVNDKTQLLHNSITFLKNLFKM